MDIKRNPDVPYLPSTLIRRSLLKELQEADKYRVILISAPPGYGKTTLVTQFVQTTHHFVAWHTLSERERDLPNLHLHAIHAFEAVVPEIQSLQEISTQQSPHDLAIKIAYFLRDHLTHDIFYVLDDVHFLNGSPAAEEWLRTLVEAMPPKCHLIILSRVLPDLPLMEMIARREILAFGQEKLCFSADEITELVAQFAQNPVSPGQISELAVLEGWPAGVILALRPLPPEVLLAFQGRGPEALFNFLAGTMLRYQLPDIRNFLLASSVLTRITPELCTKALGVANSHEMLGVVLSQQLFTSRVPGGVIYHQLFRDFLQSELKQRSPEQFSHLHLKAAHWFQANEDFELAFTHYLAAADRTSAAEVAEFVAHDYFVHGRVETLLEWKEKLRPYLVPMPNLLHKCAIILADRYQYELAEADLIRAAKEFKKLNNSTGLQLVEFQKAVINLQRGNYRKAIAQAKLLSNQPVESANLRGRILRILGVANLRLGDLKEAAVHLEAALPLHREYGDTYAVANLLQDLGAVYLQSNRFTKAGEALQEVVTLLRSLNNPIPLSLALNNLGYFFHLQGIYPQAFQAFQEGLKGVTRATNPRAEGYLLWSFGDLLRDCGNFKQAQNLYQKSIQLIADYEPSLKVSVITSLSTLRRWQHRWEEAANLAEEAVSLSEKYHLVSEKQVAQASLWVARANLKEGTRALDALIKIRDYFKKQSNTIEFVRVSGLCAHVALLHRDTLAAENFLRAATHVIIQPLIAEIAYTPLLQTFLNTVSEKYSPLISGLAQLKAQAHEQNTARVDLQRTFSLRVFTLGKEAIERDGQSIPLSEWQANRARELFYYLLFMGGNSRENICLLFWPESSSQRVRSNFHTTLYRARKAVGEDTIIFQDGVYLINPEIKIWCDAHEMERCIQLASHLSSQNPRTEDLWQKGVNLYRGDFLPSIDSEWMISLREGLRESYARALLGLAECMQVRQDHPAALSLLHIALNIDPYREEIHRAILFSYARQGEKHKLKKHYEDLKRFLSTELAILPSEETTSLLQSLLNS